MNSEEVYTSNNSILHKTVQHHNYTMFFKKIKSKIIIMLPKIKKLSGEAWLRRREAFAAIYKSFPIQILLLIFCCEKSFERLSSTFAIPANIILRYRFDVNMNSYIFNSKCYDFDITLKRGWIAMAGNYYSPFSLRISEDLLDKIQYLASLNKRSANREIEFILEQHIRNYEAEHGTIPTSQAK